MKLSETTIGELYSALSTQEISQLSKYIENNHSSAANILYRLHKTLSHCKSEGSLPERDYDYIKKEVFGAKNMPHTKLTTYVNKLHRIIKEFVILSKIEEKNLYTEVLWGEFLIENNLKRNLIINQSNYKLDLYGDQYPVQKEYYHSREKFFLNFVKSDKKTFQAISYNTIDMMVKFDYYYQSQMIDNFRTLYSFSNWNDIKKQDGLEEKLEALFVIGTQSGNPLVRYNALMLSILVNRDENSFQDLLEIFFEKSDSLSIELMMTISNSLLDYTVGRQAKSNHDKFSIDSYRIYNVLYNNGQLIPTPAQAHTRLGTFIIYELKHGNSERAREILRNSIGSVSSQQRDSCEKLCLARIEFAEKNYEEARIYIDQGNTNDSLHYYPLFKTMLLKILIYLKDELRFAMERENLYKFLHKNKSLGEKNVQSYLKFYKYVDYMNEAKFKTLSPYMREKLEKALSPESEPFHDKEWMRGRFEELVKKAMKEVE